MVWKENFKTQNKNGCTSFFHLKKIVSLACLKAYTSNKNITKLTKPRFSFLFLMWNYRIILIEKYKLKNQIIYITI